MSKRIVAGITMALMAALAGCQAPASTAPQSQMLMKQLPKASKVVTNPTNKSQLGSLKTVVHGDFGPKGRSLLFVAADVESLIIDLANVNNPLRVYDQTLVKADGDFGGSQATSIINGIFPGDYSVTISARDLNGNDIGGGSSGQTPVTISSGVTATATINVQLAPTAAGALNTTINIVNAPGE